MLSIAKNHGFGTHSRKNTDVRCRYFESKVLYHLVNELDIFLDNECVNSDQILSWEFHQDFQTGLFVGVLLYV